MSKKIGYIRVSTTDQNPDRQLESIQVDKKFIDFASAMSKDRPQLKAMMEFIREGDEVVIHSMDRLARCLRDLRALVDQMVKMGVKVNFIKENLIFTNEQNALSNLMLSIMGAFAEFEWAFIRERQKEGIEIAKKRGVYALKRKKLTPEKIEILKREIVTRKSRLKIAQDLGISRACLYKYMKKYL